MTLPATADDNTETNQEPLPKLIGKQALWLKNYLNQDNSETFLNRAQSAKYAKYNANSYAGFCQIGYENYIKLERHISQWIEDYGLSETQLKRKLISLINAKKTVFQKVKGHTNAEDLAPGVIEIAKTNIMAWAGKGEKKEKYDNGETILAIPIEDPEVQRKTLDMALKVKGLYKDDGLSGIRPIFNVAFMSITPGPSLPGRQQQPMIDVTPAQQIEDNEIDDFSDI